MEPFIKEEELVPEFHSVESMKEEWSNAGEEHPHEPLKLEFPVKYIKEEWCEVQETSDTMTFKSECKDEVTIDEYILGLEEGPLETMSSLSNSTSAGPTASVSANTSSSSNREHIEVLATSKTRRKINHSNNINIKKSVSGQYSTKKSAVHTNRNVETILENYSMLLKFDNDSKLHFGEQLGIHNDEKGYTCEQCSKSFTTKSNLRVHLRMHSGEKNYKCDECGNSFTTSSHLKMHLRIHAGIKDYKCHECGSYFTRKGTLKLHERTHTGEKDYKCDVCGKCFSRRETLKLHKRIHTGEKHYKCKECGKNFTRASDLKRHLRIHTGEKEYQCEDCGKCFTTNGELKAHSRMYCALND